MPDRAAPSSNPPQTGLPYRADLDGMRAVAVLAVMAFHAAPGQMPGGFVGVDIFFVISGFLITSILVRRDFSRSSLLHFYGRRVRRLFPALILLLISATVIAWLILPARDLQRFLGELLGAALYVPNFVFMDEGGYFFFPADKPLLHLWSLGVEEQFYLAWPLLLALLLRSRGPLVLLALFGAASFLLSVVNSQAGGDEAFYLPFTRAWQLFAGAALAITSDGARRAMAARGNALAAAGGLLIALALAIVERGNPYPGWWALLPTAGATLLIAAGPGAWLNRRVLSHRFAVAIGLISYPLYLWHWPLISFSSALTFDQLPWTWRLGAVLISFPLAWATYRWVEIPVRRGNRPPTAALVGGMGLIACIALLAIRAQAFQPVRPSVDPRREFISSYRQLTKEMSRGPGGCSLGDFDGTEALDLPPHCLRGGPSGTWLLLGDSHARSLEPGLRRAMPSGTALAAVTALGCPPLMRGKPGCDRAADQAQALVRRLRPELVLLVQRRDHDRRDWAAIARQLKDSGAGMVAVLGPVPQWQRGLPQIAVTHFWPNVPQVIGRELDGTIIRTDRRLAAQLAGRPAIGYIPLIDRLCSPAGCRAVVGSGTGSTLLHMDQSHLTAEGARFVAQEIVVPSGVALRRTRGTVVRY